MTDFKYVIQEEDKELHIKGLLKSKFKYSSRQLTKIKFNDLCYLNGESVPLWITPNAGDELVIKQLEEASDFPMEDIPIYPVYEDENILVINKQPGYVVHPTKGQPNHTIANGLMKYMADTDQNFKVRFVNRLDRDTSGLLIVAKNAYSQDQLSHQHMHKEYKAIVKGEFIEDNGTIDIPIGRPDPDNVMRGVMEDGYPSITHYSVLERFKGYTLVGLKLETGRTHQIRVHMNHIGHPVLGDSLYDDYSDLIPRQALHAFKLEFKHPVTGESLSLTADLPKDMENVIYTLKNDC
ncbi:MAG: RluA family pseudouridine synthase [Clostridia bacterium]|nr:RluA family pseudouridine synthase [Clostridia bacterium]